MAGPLQASLKLQQTPALSEALSKIEEGRLNLARRDTWQAAGWPERHRLRRIQLERWPEWTIAREKSIKVIDAGGMLALIGIPGTGKTQIATECGKYICMIPKSCVYVKAQEFFKTVREAYGPGRPLTELQIIKRFRRPHLLVLDDLHVRAESEDENRLLHFILDKRYDDMTPTIVVANQSPAEFRESIGDPLFTRLKETGGYIECNWACIRAELGES